MAYRAVCGARWKVLAPRVSLTLCWWLGTGKARHLDDARAWFWVHFLRHRVRHYMRLGGLRNLLALGVSGSFECGEDAEDGEELCLAVWSSAY